MILAYKKIICFISTENLPADYIYTDHYRIAVSFKHAVLIRKMII